MVNNFDFLSLILHKNNVVQQYLTEYNQTAIDIFKKFSPNCKMLSKDR